MAEGNERDLQQRADALNGRVAEGIRQGELDDRRFAALLGEVFTFQYEHLPVVRALADRAGVSPPSFRSAGPDGGPSAWLALPAVPTAAFKRTRLFAGEHVAQTFTSSGTSGQQKSQSHFSESGLALMDAAIEVNARLSLFPDGRRSRILVLAPPPDAAPQMIMAWGMRQLIEHFGLPGSGFLIGPDGLDVPGLLGRLQEATRDNVPVTLIGASFGFVHLLDGLAEKGFRIALPVGSRVMDAGGFKGRSRVVTREDLEGLITAHLGVPAARTISLLGMTELASQFYDGDCGTGQRRKCNAPWTRTAVLDPATLTEVAVGERGLLRHLDLANVERPLVVQTDDVGVRLPGGWQILGRAAGADARGCSLTVEELLR